MEALSALGLKPICVLPDQRAKPRICFQNPNPKSPNSPSFDTNTPNWREKVSRNFHGSLVVLASSLSAKFASALTYEEALQQSVTSNSGSDFDVGNLFAGIDPLVFAGGAAIIALPLILSRVFGGKPKSFGVESAKSAYAKLGDDPNAQLLDIRSLKELREVGTPDLRGLKKKTVSVVYNGEEKPGFLQKLALKFKEPESTTLYILDKFDGNSELVAELVTANGFKAAYAVKDGAEGPRGWTNSNLPWISPKKALNLDLSGLTEAFGGALDGDDGIFPVTLGLAAAAGVGFLAFTEIETVLQLLGSAALVQLFSKKLLFAEERKETLKQLDEFLTTKIAPKELVSDFKQIGSAFLPTVSSRALPAPTEEYAPEPEATLTPTPTTTPAPTEEYAPEPEATLTPTSTPTPAPTEEYAPEPEATLTPTPTPTNGVPKTETVVESSEPEVAQKPATLEATVNSAPPEEVKSKSKSHFRALSPYPSYPDLKPPTSPSPSQP